MLILLEYYNICFMYIEMNAKLVMSGNIHRN